MNKLYQRINWQNYPSDSTPLNESNLNKMDAAVDGIDDRVVTLDVTKLPVSTANTMVKDVTFNETTGVFTITKLNGTKVTVNTALEKIATNFRFDHSTQKLILTLIDGTTQEVDLSALLTQYEFLNSSTIQFTIDSSGKVKASVVNGSITGDMLEPNYLANVTLQASKADTSAKNAKESEEKAAEYAESAKNSADSAEPVASTATGANPTIQDSTNAPLIYGKFKGYTLQDGEPTPDNPVEINGLAKNGAIEVKTTGKNLLNSSGFTQKTTYGITYTPVYNDKGKLLYINVNGTATENSVYSFNTNQEKIKNGDFILSGGFTGGSSSTYYLGLRTELNGNAKGYSSYGGDTKFTLSENNIYVDCYIGILKGVTVNNIKFYPMIRKAEIADDTYEPYQGETTANIPTDAPLYEGDYLEVYADGSGKEYRKMKEIVFDGSDDEKFSLSNTYTNENRTGCYIELSNAKHVYDGAKSASDYFTKITCTIAKNDVSKTGFWVGDTVYNPDRPFCLFALPSSIVTDLATFKTWLQANPVKVVYELAEPTETPLTAEQVAQFKQLYTFEPVTNVLCDGEVEMIYLKNTNGGKALASVRRGVEHADTATTATKATQDGNGNAIAETYAKKSNVLSSVAECEASTNIEDIAGASALSELNEVCLKVKNGANATVDLSAGVKLKDLLSTFQLSQKGSYLNVLELVVRNTGSETYENAFLHIEDSGLYLNSTPFTTKLSGKAITMIPIDGYVQMINGIIYVNTNGNAPKLKVVKARVVCS